MGLIRVVLGLYRGYVGVILGSWGSMRVMKRLGVSSMDAEPQALNLEKLESEFKLVAWYSF